MPGEATGASPLADARGSVTDTQLYLRPLDSDEPRPIAGTEGAANPFFSPDGQWIGFFANGKLQKISINGGVVVLLASAPIPGGAAWGGQGLLAFQNTKSSGIGLQQVGQEGGPAHALTQMGIGGTYHNWPDYLPDGRGILFAAAATSTTWNNAQVLLQPAEGGKLESLAQGMQPRYASVSPDGGYLLFAQAGGMMAAPFDPLQKKLSGTPVSVLQGLMQSITAGSAQYSVSKTGTLIYLAGSLSGSQSRMVWLTQSGAESPLPAGSGTYGFPRVSPDGRRIAVAITHQDTQIGVYDLGRDTLARLTLDGTLNVTPVWTPDGGRIAFNSNRADTAKPLNVYLQAADGSAPAQRLRYSEFLQAAASFSPDGKLLAYTLLAPGTGRDIWVMNLETQEDQPILQTPAEEGGPKFSPDGKWLAYSSDESGRREIYVQPYPGPGGKWLISTEGGQEPVWNPNRGELYYRSGSKMMAVGIDTKAGFQAGKPRMLFDGPYLPTTATNPFYDVSPDGQRFLMLKPVETEATAPTQINVVLNWFEELKQKVPVK